MRKTSFLAKKTALVLIGLTLSATVGFGAAGLSGTYLVPGNFASLTNAGGVFDALNTQGASGNITILITANLTGETGAVSLNELAGGRTVLIKPDGAARTITGTSTNSSLINLNGADNVTIDGSLSLSGGDDRSLTISDGNPNGAVIRIFGTGNGANGNTVKNCIISGNPGTAASAISVFGNNGVQNSNNVIRNNQIFRVQYGVLLARNDGVTFDQNWIITGNSLGSAVAADKLGAGILMRGSQNFTISNNTIAGLSSGLPFTAAIQIEAAMVGVVSGNKISGVAITSSGGESTGIYLNSSSTTASITVSNNVISDVSSATSNQAIPAVYGIRILQGGGYKIYDNSVNLFPSQDDANRISTALYVASAVNTAGGIDLRDNILVNSKTAGTRYAIYNDSGAGAAVFSTINHNDYFAQNVGYSGGATKVTLGDWKATTGQDANSLSVNPSFYSATDLHITLDSLVATKGIPLPSVPVDFDSEIRFTGQTDIGADEATQGCPSFTETFDAVSAPALPGGWTSASSGSEIPWLTSTVTPASFPNAALATDTASVGATELVSPVIAVPPGGAQLRFLNAYNLEQSSDGVTGFDGMVLEVSVQGDPFGDVTQQGISFVTGGYTHTMATCCSSAIGGRMAWSGLSGGTTTAPLYRLTILNLPGSVGGVNLQFKWRVVCDATAVPPGLSGVRIDNIGIFPNQCSPPPAHHFAVIAPANATIGSAFNFTVTALAQSNAAATGYSGTVHFTSTDGSATLPANSTLTNGTGTFSATLHTGGNHTITSTDTVTSSITGTSNTIAVPIPTPTATATATPTATATATPTATATATATPTPGLVGNVSTRLPVGTGDNVLIEGFIVLGPSGSTKNIIVRAIGPSLIPFGILDALADPTLEIHDSNNAIVATSDDWGTTQVGGIIPGDQSQAISASGVAPSNGLESAIIANLAPGSYTAVVRGVDNGIGTGVVDAYDLSSGSPARLANIATRGLIQPGDKLMIAGFIIQNGPVQAVVRAIGPSLSAFGITNALPDTTLQVKDQNGNTVIENDDWQSSQKQELENTGLQPSHNLEAAVVVTLPPGQYTAQVRGKPETTGIGVVQAYFLQ